MYFFYGKGGELLYIGKSKYIRDRVKAHFQPNSSKNTVKFHNEIHDISFERTAGEFGALLLESQLIKERLPLYNKLLRYGRSMTVAVLGKDRDGMLNVQYVDGFEGIQYENIVGVFKSVKQSKDYFSKHRDEFRLCERSFGLEGNRKGACFSFHLGKCDGVCHGEENIDKYNSRLEASVGHIKVKRWPYGGPIAIHEYDKEQNLSTLHIINQWSYLGIAYAEEEIESLVQSNHQFDYDNYKLIKSFLSTQSAKISVTELRKN